MRIDPRHLNAVRAIVEHGTFSRAADALGVSQPALSKSISLLERRLGARLFERSARGSTLTEAGQVVARHAAGLDMLLVRLQEEVAARSERRDGPLNIGATPSMMFGLVPEALTRTLAANPRLIVNIREDLDDALYPLLRRGDIDLLVTPLEDSQPVSADLVEIRFANEPVFVVLPAGHALSEAKRLRLADLRDEAWILPTAGGSFHRLAQALFIHAEVRWPQNAIGTNRLHVYPRLVIETGRVAIATAAQLLGAPDSIVAVPLAGAPRRPLGIKYRHGVKLPPAAEEFIGKLREVAADLGISHPD